MMAVFAVLIPLVLALVAAPAALLAEALKPAYAAPIGTTFAALDESGKDLPEAPGR